MHAYRYNNDYYLRDFNISEMFVMYFYAFWIKYHIMFAFWVK